MSQTLAPQSDWFSQVEAGEHIGVTDRTIRNYIARGLLPGHRVQGSRLVRVKRSDLDALLVPMPATRCQR